MIFRFSQIFYFCSSNERRSIAWELQVQSDSKKGRTGESAIELRQLIVTYW